MKLEYVLIGLLRKRQSIADDLEATQNRMRRLVQDIDAVDATIRLFQPDLQIGIVRIRPTTPAHRLPRREQPHDPEPVAGGRGSRCRRATWCWRSWQRVG
jgi:hypothetical protein